MIKINHLLKLLQFYWVKIFFHRRLINHGRNYFSAGKVHIQPQGRWILFNSNVFDLDFDIEIWGELKMGSRNYINKNVKIVCLDRIEIGDDCLFADSVHVYDHDHRFDRLDIPIKDQGYKTAPIKIGNNVWLGAKATVLKGVTIGDGVVVGANAVVTTDLPANSICAGNPAKVIRVIQ